jgi:hypothetical protein
MYAPVKVESSVPSVEVIQQTIRERKIGAKNNCSA